MFKRILVLLVLLAVGLAAPLAAGEVAATLLKTSGSGRLLLPDGSAGEFKPGTLVQPGSRIITSEGGLAVLMMDDGSRISLGPNTDLKVAESKVEGSARSTVFEMVKGLFKATVQKLTVGSRFEVRTTDAVAAVKGTSFAVTADERGTKAEVEEGTVWLENGRGERAVLGRGMRALADRAGRIGEVRPMTEEERRNFAAWALSSLPGSVRPQEKDDSYWSRLRPEQQRKLVQAFWAGLGQEAWDDLTQLRAEERQEHWKARLRAADERGLAAEESRVDFALRKATLDRHGKRVRFEEYLLRPAADQLQFLNYTRREGKTDFLSSINTYNRGLPYNLGLVRGLNQKGWNQVLPPLYWVTEQYQVMGNSLGDSFASRIEFFDPVRVGLDRWELPVQSRQVAINLSDLNNIASGEVLERWERRDTNTGTVVVGSTSVLGPGSSVTGNNVIGAAAARSSDLVWTGPGQVPEYRLLGPGELGAEPGDFAGGVQITYKDALGRVTHKLQYRSYAIDENGRILNLGRLLDKSPLDAVIDYAFNSLQEIELSSDAFKGEVDVVSKLLRLYDISKNHDSL